MPLCPAAAAHVLVKLASYKGSLTCFERPIKTQWHTWVYKQAIIALLDTGTPLLVQHENLKLHHFTSNLLKTNANCMHKPNKSILYLKFVDWSIPARARRRPAMGTGQLRSLSWLRRYEGSDTGLCPAAAVHVLVKLGSYKGSLC